MLMKSYLWVFLFHSDPYLVTIIGGIWNRKFIQELDCLLFIISLFISWLVINFPLRKQWLAQLFCNFICFYLKQQPALVINPSKNKFKWMSWFTCNNDWQQSNIVILTWQPFKLQSIVKSVKSLKYKWNRQFVNFIIAYLPFRSFFFVLVYKNF